MSVLSRLSIRARITLGSILVAAVIFSIALVAVRVQVATILTTADSTLARGDLNSFADEIVANPANTLDDPGTGVLLFVRAPDGTVQVDTMPHIVREHLEHREGADEQLTQDVEGTDFVVVGRALHTSAGTWSLWAARSTASSALALQGLDSTLIIGALVLLAGFGVASWVLASAALRPVERMRRKAELLGADPSEGGLPVGPARDEIAELASTLNALLDRIRQSTEREKQMVSDAAHELRTPLSVLKTQLELAHDDFGDAEALARQLVAAEVSVERLSALATNMLELSKLEAAGTPTTPSSTEELVTELMGSVDRARMLAIAKDVEVAFAVNVTGEDAAFALGQHSFGRVVDNLLSNAIAAVHEEGVVTASLTTEAGALVLEIRDDGPGMRESFLPHAFDRFSRPDDSRTSSTGGSGLGLALVGAIVDSSGGSVSLHNGGPGLVVTVRLPQM
ncbi:ATP-binding protein [Lacisediminihabitans sp.]|uniref:ATP-binding protein n=1 Tax=Lacisediminihabitans sp. TaxID=2787631 RepID=UPI00374CE899